MSETNDQSTLFSLVANCSLYEEDPQPAQMNIGTATEPRMVASSEGWRDYYARYLIQDLDADLARITSVRDWARTELPQARPSRPDSNHFGQDEWAIAIELCDRAATMIREAGADQDPYARRRLLAGINSALMTQTLGMIPSVAQDVAADLIAELQQIDADEQRERGTARTVIQELQARFRAQLESLIDDITSLDGVVGLHLMMWAPDAEHCGHGGDLGELYVDLYDNTGENPQQLVLDVNDGGHQTALTLENAIDVLQTWIHAHHLQARDVTTSKIPGEPQHTWSAEFDGGKATPTP